MLDDTKKHLSPAIKAAFTAIFGDDMDVAKNAWMMFILDEPYRADLSNRLQQWVEARHFDLSSVSEGARTRVRISAEGMRTLDRELSGEVKKENSGAINRMLYAYRHNDPAVSVEIPLADDGAQLDVVNRHFNFLTLMTLVLHDGKAYAQLNLPMFQTLQHAGTRVAHLGLGPKRGGQVGAVARHLGIHPSLIRTRGNTQDETGEPTVANRIPPMADFPFKKQMRWAGLAPEPVNDDKKSPQR